MFPEKLQEEVWGSDPDATASSSIAPFGRTEEVEGGVTFSGEMGWSSGCDHAEWAILGFRRKNAEGTQDYCFAVLPSSDYEIRDDWYAIGMRGSGSKTLIVENAFVPEHRIQKAKDMMEGNSAGFGLYPDSKIFYAPYRPYFASGFSTVSLGIAERMLEVFREKTKNRVRAYTGAAVGAATPALMRLAADLPTRLQLLAPCSKRAGTRLPTIANATNTLPARNAGLLAYQPGLCHQDVHPGSGPFDGGGRWRRLV